MAKHIEAVVFDLDDTLIDWANAAVTWQEFTRPCIDRIRAYLIAAGHSLPSPDQFFAIVEEDMQSAWREARKNWEIKSIGQILLQTLIELGLDPSRIDVDELLRIYAWAPLPGVVPYEDTHSVLEEIRRREYKIGLLTNSFMPMWMRDVELDAYRLMDYLDARVTSGDIGYLKPHPAIYHAILEVLDTPPEKAVFVGDRPVNDIAGANQAGLTSVLINPPHLERDLDGVVPDFTITRLGELLPVLESLEAK
jgi:putative hydrolase of the HAD superfamily